MVQEELVSKRRSIDLDDVPVAEFNLPALPWSETVRIDIGPRNYFSIGFLAFSQAFMPPSRLYR
jgi:hypothetical protein